jgi:hypothetical protein
MCYAATHPEKLDGAKLAQWQKLARLGDADIATLTNLECLGVPVLKRAKPGRLAGLVRKRNRAVRKVPPGGLFVTRSWHRCRGPAGAEHTRTWPRRSTARPCTRCKLINRPAPTADSVNADISMSCAKVFTE